MTDIGFGPRDRQGPKLPRPGTPARLPGSVRRTSTFDGLHPQGQSGPVELRLRARDLRTGIDGEVVEIGRVSVTIVVDRERGVLEIEAEPADDRLRQLLGASPYSGWRRTVDELLAGDLQRQSLLYPMLDAVPAWMVLSSFGLADMPSAGRSEASLGAPYARTFDVSSRVDLCAGWQRGGTLLQLLSAGHNSADFVRPEAPPLDLVGDPLSWHDFDALPIYGSRRYRRVDVIGGHPLSIDAMFRDTSVNRNGVEGVLHEYEVTAAVDPATWTVTRATALPRSLPFEECPQAQVSSTQLVGHDVRDMRRYVGREMRGTTTCTHLNELYRTFADVEALTDFL